MQQAKIGITSTQVLKMRGSDDFVTAFPYYLIGAASAPNAGA